MTRELFLSIKPILNRNKNIASRPINLHIQSVLNKICCFTIQWFIYFVNQASFKSENIFKSQCIIAILFRPNSTCCRWWCKILGLHLVGQSSIETYGPVLIEEGPKHPPSFCANASLTAISVKAEEILWEHASYCSIGIVLTPQVHHSGWDYCLVFKPGYPFITI